MPPWRVKAAAQGVVSLLPQPHRWNRYLRQYCSHTLSLDDVTFMTHLAHFRCHRPVLRHRDPSTTRVLELGTGSVPVTPLALWLGGIGDVVTWDVVDQWSDRLAGEAAARLLRRARAGRFRLADPERAARLAQLLDERGGRLERSIVGTLGIRALVGDASVSCMEDASVDVFVSNATLEHIPRSGIAATFTEFARLAAPCAQMSHYVDLADHYRSFDRHINAFHFLRYDERAWRKYNNRLHYQNRLRLPDYRDLHCATGWRITREELGSGSARDLDGIRLAPQFEAYATEDLLVHRAVLVSCGGSPT